MAVKALLQVAQKNLVCFICYALLRSPVVFPCGHVFCRTCAEHSIKERPRCPLCNHAVASRRVMTPLPTIAAIMGIVHDVAKFLRQCQAANAATGAVASVSAMRPTSALMVNNNYGTVKKSWGDATEDGRSTNATVSCWSSSNSVASVGDGGAVEALTPRSSVDSLETRLLHTSPLPVVMLMDDVTARSNDVETQSMFCASAAMSLPFSYQYRCRLCVLRRCFSEGGGDDALQRIGCCVLCGLDIKDRTKVADFLRRIIETDPSCDCMRLRRLSEVTFSECLGPMWELRVTTNSDEMGKEKEVGSRKRGRYEGEEHLPTVLVHQSCFEWCLLRGRVNGAATREVTIAETMIEQLFRSVCSDACSFCGQCTGGCLVPCERCKHRTYHYPCALLTGPGVCVIATKIGTLLCAECLQEQQQQEMVGV